MDRAGSSVHGISQARSGLPFPSPGDLPDPEIKLMSPALARRFITTEPSGKPSICYPRQRVEKQRFHFANKGSYSQSYGFPVRMWELDHKKAEHWRIDAFELWCWKRLLRVPWIKGIKLIIPKGNQPIILFGSADAEAEASILWPPDGKEPTHWIRPRCWKRLSTRGEGVAVNEMVVWHHWLNRQEFI